MAHEGSQLSCCAIVQGLQRSVFVVPKPGTFDDDAELEDLQARAEGDASLKGPLMKRLHVSRLESPAHNSHADLGRQSCLHKGLHVSVCKTGSGVWSLGSLVMDASLIPHVCRCDRLAQCFLI